MKCELMTVELLRERALKILNDSTSIKNTSKELDLSIVDIGYEGCESADKKTEQCLDLYMRNLGNSGGRGPNSKLPALNKIVFASLVTNNKINRVSPQMIAERYLSASQNKNDKFVSTSSSTDYVDQLRKFSKGQDLGRSTLISWLKSTAEFINFLVDHHNGNAETFTSEVRKKIQSCNNQIIFIESLVKSFIPFHGLGYALAANFIKDLFATQLNKNLSINKQKDCLSAWCVKPDMHVARLMLCITDRAKLTEGIIKMKINDVTDLYRKQAPSSTWAQLSDYVYPEDGIAHDVHLLARSADCASLEIDRLLFMCGSGNFGQSLKGDNNAKREQRYISIINEIN